MEDTSRIKQGDENYKKGMSALSTGLFKWSKDYVSAAMYFEDAAKFYKAGKLYDKNLLAIEKLVEVNKKLNDNWAVARNYEQIVMISIENIEKPDYNKIVDNSRAAGLYFKAADSPSNLVQLYTKVSRYFEKLKQFDLAKVMLKEALQEAAENNIPHTIGDLVNAYIQVLVESESISEAINVYRDEIERNKADPSKSSVMQYCLACLALYVISAETINAENFIQKCISEVVGFLKSRELEACEKLLDYFNEGNQEEFDKFVLKPPVSSIFPINIVKQLKKVKVRSTAAKMPDIRELDNVADNQEQMNEELRKQELNKLLL